MVGGRFSGLFSDIRPLEDTPFRENHTFSVRRPAADQCGGRFFVCCFIQALRLVSRIQNSCTDSVGHIVSHQNDPAADFRRQLSKPSVCLLLNGSEPCKSGCHQNALSFKLLQSPQGFFRLIGIGIPAVIQEHGIRNRHQLHAVRHRHNHRHPIPDFPFRHSQCARSRNGSDQKPDPPLADKRCRILFSLSFGI